LIAIVIFRICYLLPVLRAFLSPAASVIFSVTRGNIFVDANRNIRINGVLP
jgi:hypothetical protein